MEPIEILREVLEAAGSSDDMPVVHWERRDDGEVPAFRVWPRDNGAPFTLAVTHVGRA